MKTVIIFNSFLLSAWSLIGQKVSFPSAVSSTDPSKRYSVVWSEATDSTDHLLVLHDLKTGKIRQLLKFSRHADFFWAPDGNAFAVTNWGGSDFSEAWIGFPQDSTRIIRLNMSSPETEKNHHVFFEVVRWRSNSSLLFKVNGGEHDPNGFEKFYTCKLDGKINEFKKAKN